jgi:methylated-DNA-[protein]-cysteine S-methyltransferase
MKNTEFAYLSFDSPVGPLLIGWDESGLRCLHFQAGPCPLAPPSSWRCGDRFPGEVREQLRAYFAGALRQFDLPLVPEGTTFQQEVWAVLAEIPYGRTLSYAGLARRMGQPRAVRAVGAASSQNPLPIFIPCHRVIGSNGALTGYIGGLRVKETLLALERKYRSQAAEQLTLL